MKTLSVPFSALSKERSMRCDFSFQSYQTVLISRTREYYLLDELFEVCSPSPIKADQIEGSFMYCQIGDIDKWGNAAPTILDFATRDEQNEDYYKKIEKGNIIAVEENDVLMSFLIPADFSNIGKFVRINDSLCDIYFTSAFLQLRPKVSPLLMYYALRSIFYSDIANVSRVKKGYTGYATISADDLRNARLDKQMIDTLMSATDTLTPQIVEIEKCLMEAETTLRTTQSVIDDVFAQEFGFDYAKFEELKTQMRFSTKFSSFSNNPDMRFSVKFHRGAGAFVMEQLTSITNKKIKHHLSGPIILGASVSPIDYSDAGDCYYISMATIKNWRFEEEDAQLVSNDYSRNNQAKEIQVNDIIMARSGEGTIGKVALIDNSNLKGIFADFTMRIRFASYNCKFSYYYFRTRYFQYLVEVYKKGLGNNTNIFPIVLQEFPLPDISLNEQQCVVDEIQAEINRQNKIKTQIASFRRKIDAIIESTLTT